MSNEKKSLVLRYALLVYSFAAMSVSGNILWNQYFIDSYPELKVEEIIRIDNPEPETSAHFGWSVDGFNDIDGDGVGELIIGATGSDRVYIISGSSRNIIHILQDPDDLQGNRFGFAVCNVGYQNGDGIEDIAVGAPGPHGFLPIPVFDDEPPPDWGRVFIFSGSTGDLIRRYLPDDMDFFAFGSSIASLGDLDNDDIVDIAVGSPVLMHYLGEVYAFSGADSNQLWVRQELRPSAGENQQIASFGLDVADIGDLNGDGFKDLLVEARFHDYDPDPAGYNLAGLAYVLDGSDGSIIDVHTNPTPPDEDMFGCSPGALGDQNGDGIEDYAFGECGVGLVHLYSGPSGRLIRDIENPGEGDTDYFGFQIARACDINDDGYDEFWVSAPGANVVYLMNKKGDSLIQVEDPSPIVINSLAGFGRSISTTGDLDNDGGPDLIIGKPYESVNGFEQAGAAFIVLGVTKACAREKFYLTVIAFIGIISSITSFVIWYQKFHKA